VTADPDEASAHNDRGRRLADEELFDQAIQEYRQADKLWQKAASKDRKRALCNWADALREQEHHEQAAEKCREAIELDREFPEAYNSLGQVRAAQECFDGAIEQYHQADKLWQKAASKDRKRALCNWADALREQGHHEQAAEKCREAIELDREFPDAYNSLGLVRAAQERFDEAIEQYRQADKLWQKAASKNRKRALSNWAGALLLQGHHEEAADKCLEAIGIDREFAYAYNSLGQVRAAQERFDEAIEQYCQADELCQKKGSKNRKHALRGWADALRAQEHYAQAAKKCQEAIELDRLDPWGHVSLGQVRTAQERFDEAIEQYRQADELWEKKGSKNRKYALSNWADALLLQGHHEEAADKCLEAIGIDREFAYAYHTLGRVRAAQERFDEAIEQYCQADELCQKKGSKNRKHALRGWADALREQEHYEEAAEKCQEDIELDRLDPRGHMSFGLVRKAQKRFDEAIEQYRQADELWEKKGSRNRKYALLLWADALREQEDYEEAAEKCQDAISIDPHYLSGYILFGDIRAAQERFDEAIEQYRHADKLRQEKESKASKNVLRGWLSRWADVLRKQEHYEQATEKCQEAIELDREFPDAYIALGHVRAEQDRFNEAIEQYRQADELLRKKGSKDRKYALRDWAGALHLQGHYDEAAEKCQEAIGIDREFPDAYRNLGQVRAAQKRFDETSYGRTRGPTIANTHCATGQTRCTCKGTTTRLPRSARRPSASIGNSPTSTSALATCARSRTALTKRSSNTAKRTSCCGRRVPRTVSTLCATGRNTCASRSTTSRPPRSARRLSNSIGNSLTPTSVSGRVRTNQERFDEAIEQYRRADELLQKKGSKDRKHALRDWADALCLQGHYEEAADKCLEAIGIDREFPDAYRALGDVRVAQERFDEAIEQYRQYGKLPQEGGKNRKNSLLYWAIALREQKHYEEAAKMCLEAIEVDRLYPWSFMLFGGIRAAQERFHEAIEQYRQADALFQKKESKGRKYALWYWGSALRQQEKFEDANTKFDCARQIFKDDKQAVYLYGNSLIDLGQCQDAIAQFDKASMLDQDDPEPRHNKANLLFSLGQYEQAWTEMGTARQCYERLLGGQLRSAEQLRKAINFADILGIFESYEDADKLYKRVLERQEGNANAWVGRAILNQQWANSDVKKPPEILARLSYLARRARESLKRQLGKGADFQTYLNFADFYIAFDDWTEAREQLDLAELICGGSRLKRAQVTERRGLVCYRVEDHAEAVKYLKRALLAKPENWTLRCYLGNALLRLKQFETARDQFARVLTFAPRNIDALRGAAQVAIELAEDGDPDQYETAARYLTDALTYGENKESGSKHLSKSELADIYYARGYVRTKSYEADASGTTSIALKAALGDFLECKKMDPNYSKARVSIEKINKGLRQLRVESLVNVWGPVCIFCSSVIVFLMAQVFFISAWWSKAYSVKDELMVYISLTFPSLAFMVAGVYLPQLLKLKLPGIELEKASVAGVSAPSIEISRPMTLIRVSGRADFRI
jgi:tetratricopeptide (TPR) repeat protein